MATLREDAGEHCVTLKEAVGGTTITGQLLHLDDQGELVVDVEDVSDDRS